MTPTVPPRRRHSFLVKFLVAVAFVAVLSPLLIQPVVVDVSPLCELNALDVGDLNPKTARAESRSTYALTDGLAKPDHLFEFPSPQAVLHAALPTAFALEEIVVVSTRGHAFDPLVAHFSTDGVTLAKSLKTAWAHPPSRTAALTFDVDLPRTRAVEFHPPGPGPHLWNAVYLAFKQPRMAAWLYVWLLTLALPIVVALGFVLGAVGFGTVLRSAEPAAIVVQGVVVAAVFALVWIVLPRSPWVDAVHAALWTVAAIRGCRSIKRSGWPPWRLTLWAAAFLVVVVEVESYAYSDGRVDPTDHLHAYYGAQRLSRDLPIPAEFSSRPWLHHVIATPWDHLTGRFGYWTYIGLTAGLNALSVLVADSAMKRLGVQQRTIPLTWFVLLPGFVNFHFLGQRLLAGAVAIIAVTWLIDRDRLTVRNAVLAGLAFIVGIGLHPSVAFALATTALLWIVQRRGWTGFVFGIAAPAVAYSVWLTAMSASYPERRNDLLYYPVMKDLNEPFAAGIPLPQVLASLSASDWGALAANRLQHWRHYLVTDSWTPSPWGWSRWISLPNVVCFGSLLLILLRRAWRGRETWCVWTILTPLAFHHLFIGQPQPQFHISPAPFLAVMLLAADSLAEVGRSSPLLQRFALAAAAAELAARLLFPLLAVKLQLERVPELTRALRLVADDPATYYMLATLPALCAFCIVRAANKYG